MTLNKWEQQRHFYHILVTDQEFPCRVGAKPQKGLANFQFSCYEKIHVKMKNY